jgi:hypothetical protein
MKKVVMGLALVVMAAGVMGCEAGAAVEVSSCAQCRADEVCVTASAKLYCSNLCVDPTVICSYGCDPMASASTSSVYWVCAPKQYYQSIPTGKASYHKMGGDCSSDLNYQCSSGEYCLQDTVESSVFFCSQACSYGTDCAQGCCATTTTGGSRCAPYYYCP